MNQKNQDTRFEEFRRDRKLRRAQALAHAAPVAQPTHTTVTKAIEAAEAREARDQVITREVHDFFADATRIAASIVQKFSAQHADESSNRVTTEMEVFLRDAIRRAESFIALLQRQGRGPEAERLLAAQMGNLVGPLLDQFRIEGTAQIADKHLGQNPFANAGEPATKRAPDVAPRIEEHIVAEVHDPEPEPKRAAARDPRIAANPMLAQIGDDPERLKKALRLLVEGGVMSRADAESIWNGASSDDAVK